MRFSRFLVMTIRLSDGQEMKSRLNSELPELPLDNYLESYSIPFLNVDNVRNERF